MIMVVIGGAFLAIFPRFINSLFLKDMIDKVFLSEMVPGSDVEFLRNWYTGVTGAVMLGWGYAMIYFVNHPLKQREKWAWRGIFYPVLVWYILDSGISAYYGVIFNVTINTILFLQIVAPLLFLRNHFFESVKIAS